MSALLPALCKVNADNFKAYLHNTLHNICAYLGEILVFVNGPANFSRFSDLKKNGSYGQQEIIHALICSMVVMV